MNFDLHEINYLFAIGTWAIVFFGVFSVGAFFAWVFAPTVAGVGGRGKLYRNLTRGSLGPVGIGLSTILAIGFGVLAYLASAYMTGFLGSITGPFLAADGQPANVIRWIDRFVIVGVAAGLAAFGGFMLIPALLESCRINFGRVWTIAVLTWKEAIRRRALYVFVVFALLFMFAGWFLGNADQRADEQVKNYVSFVLTAISWLTLPVVLLLACWGIPDDIKARSMHTVVTKPIRRNEIFLGRVLGFSLVGTAVILVMGSIGYLWIIRQVPASVTSGTAIVEGRDVQFAQADDKFIVKIARTKGEPDVYEAESPAALRREQPAIYETYRAAHAKYVRSLLTARVPVHGRLSFYDRGGKPAQGGINVGDIWEHRSYIEGGTQARAVYQFENVSDDLLVETTELQIAEDGTEQPVDVERLRIETNFEAFRSYKGDMSRSLLVQLHFVKALRREFAEALAGVEPGDPGINDFRPAYREAAQGNFEVVADRLAELSNGFETGSLKFSERAVAVLPRTYERVAALLDGVGEAWAGSMATTARDIAEAARNEQTAGMAEALATFSQLFRDHASDLTEKVVDIDVPYAPYTIAEYIGNVVHVPRTLPLQGTTKTIDLFDDVVHDGRLQIEVACMDRAQYLGMARPDLFIRTPDNWFLSGFAKAVLGIWMLLVLVVLVGVTASTFVKGPVATLAVATFVFVGVFFHSFLLEIVRGEQKGSGAIESSYRLYAHLNPNVDLDKSTAVAVIQGADSTITGFLWVVANVVPDLNVFFLNDWIANGFDVRWDSGLAPAVFTLLAYLLPCLLLGFYSLKLRELEAK